MFRSDPDGNASVDLVEELIRQRRRVGEAGSDVCVQQVWTMCAPDQISNSHREIVSKQDEKLRILWFDEGVGRVRSELDCFLVCFPTQLIPLIRQTPTHSIGLENSFTGSFTSSSSSAHSEGDGIRENISESDVFRYLSILLTASLERHESSAIKDLWVDQSLPSFGISQPPSFEHRFLMSWKKFQSINKSLHLTNGAMLSPVSSINKILDSFNHKRRSVMQSNDNVRLEDTLVIHLDDDQQFCCHRTSDVDWSRLREQMQIMGLVKAVFDAESGICLGLQMIPTDDVEISAQNSIFTERSLEAVRSLCRPMYRTPRAIFSTGDTVLCWKNVSCMLQDGAKVVIGATSVLPGLQFPRDLLQNNVSSLLMKTHTSNVTSQSSSSTADDELCAIVASAAAEHLWDVAEKDGEAVNDLVLFNIGHLDSVDTSTEVQRSLSRRLGNGSTRRVPSVVHAFQSTMARRRENSLVLSLKDMELNENQSAVFAVFFAVVIQCAIDAFHVFHLHSQSVDLEQMKDREFDLRLRGFVGRVAKALLDKAREDDRSARLPLSSDYHGLSTSVPLNDRMFNHPGQEQVNATLLLSQDQHRLLPLSKHPYYEQFKTANKRAKRRCKICHHPTGYYCLSCSDCDASIFYSLCHPTTKPDSRCYFQHLQPTDSASFSPT